MKESIKTTSVEFDMVNRITGEVMAVEGTTVEVSKYYSVSKITTRMNMTDLFSVQAEICTSSKDITLLSKLLDSMSGENRIVIVNQTKTAKKYGTTRVALSRMLNKLSSSRLGCKEDTGMYWINPYIVIGKRTRSNQAREDLQVEWNSHVE